ncbi:YopT-type cysteine protease domain-containing protein [Paraburkholderia ribeironis]
MSCRTVAKSTSNGKTVLFDPNYGECVT